MSLLIDSLIVTLLFQLLNGSLYTGPSLRSPRDQITKNIPLNPRAEASIFDYGMTASHRVGGCEADL